MSLHPGLHPGTLFHPGSLAAIVGYGIPIPDNCLVTAPSQCQIHGNPGALIGLQVSRCIDTHTDTEGHGEVVADVDGSHLVKQGEPGLNQQLQILLLKDKDEFILFKLLDDGIQVMHILDNLALHQSQKQRLPDFLHALQNFFIIVNIDKACHKILALVGLPVVNQLGLIKEIELHQIFRQLSRRLFSQKLCCRHLPALDTVLSLPEMYMNLLADSLLWEDLLIKPLKYLGDVCPDLPAPHQVLKALIKPDQVSGPVGLYIGQGEGRQRPKHCRIILAGLRHYGRSFLQGNISPA